MQEQNKVFDVINPDSARPLILTCEHASAAIPSGYDNLGFLRCGWIRILPETKAVGN